MQRTSDLCCFELSVRIFTPLDSDRVNNMSSDFLLHFSRVSCHFDSYRYDLDSAAQPCVNEIVCDPRKRMNG